jgi:hypothetical protein|tara:strand:+ start:44 stop:547 length:504 start_codon:yes stop_codon:yes gene_type:complete
MLEKPEPQIDAPIPGMSMTAPMGGRPWLKPPQFATVEESLEFYFAKFADKEFVPELLTIIELGVPLTTIANSFQLASVMEGKHSVDVGILVIPVIVEMMMAIAEANDVEYVSGMSREKERDLSNAEIALAKKRGLFDKKVERPTKKEEEKPTKEEPMMGLMSRREEM